MSLASGMLSLSCPGFIHLCSFPEDVFYRHEGTAKAFWLVPLGITYTVAFNATQDAPYHNESSCIASQLNVKPAPLQCIIQQDFMSPGPTKAPTCLSGILLPYNLN